MIFTYLGIILFITYEWAQFISKRSVKQETQPNQAGKHRISCPYERSRRLEQLLPMVQLDDADNNMESQETLSGASESKSVQSCGKLLKNPQSYKNPI